MRLAWGKLTGMLFAGQGLSWSVPVLAEIDWANWGPPLAGAAVEGVIVLGGILLAEWLRRLADRRRTVRSVYAALPETTSQCSAALHRAARIDNDDVRTSAVAATYELGRLFVTLDDACTRRWGRDPRIREEVRKLRNRMVVAKGEVLMKHSPGRPTTDLYSDDLLAAIDGLTKEEWRRRATGVPVAKD